MGRSPRLPPGKHGLTREQVAADQRSRIFRAIVALVAERGYAATTMKDVVRVAHVSRITVNQVFGFGDKESCFLWAYEAIVEHAIVRVNAAYQAEVEWTDKLGSGFQVLLEEVLERPDAARVALVEAFAAGPEALRRMDRVTHAFEDMVSSTFAASPDRISLPPLISQGIVGGVSRVLRQRLLDDTVVRLSGDADELVRWMLAYHSPAAGGLRFARVPDPTTYKKPTIGDADQTRRRLMRAAATLAAQHSYLTLNDASIARHAGVPTAAFGERFPGGAQECFLAAYDYLGAAVLARFLTRGASGEGAPGINPAQAFAQATMAKGTWEAFFALNAHDLDALRDELIDEASRYGESTYSSLTFERFPLVEIEPGLLLPLSMASLRRRVSQGLHHILSDAAIADGLNRTYYSSVFGLAFQESVERTLRRAVEMEGSGATITADVFYGSSSRRRRSSDVILEYERNPVFVEVVSGPLQAGTTTQGDLKCFASDVDRLVVEKTRQLDQSIRDFFDKDLKLPATDPALVAHAWPVLVTSHAFPHMDYILREVDRLIREKGYLQHERVGSLAIVSAEELFFCEGFMEKGTTFLALMRGWKSGPMASTPLKNYLITLGNGHAPGSQHFVHRFAEANVDYMSRMLGQQQSVESVLANMKSPDAKED